MQLTIATITALLAASGAMARPAGNVRDQPAQTATVSFSNDQTGHNAPIDAPLDGSTISIFQALADTPICAGGSCLASSAYFVAFPQGVSCAIARADGSLIAALDSQKTFADLDGNPAAATPISLDGATLRCEI